MCGFNGQFNTHNMFKLYDNKIVTTSTCVKIALMRNEEMVPQPQVSPLKITNGSAIVR